jgi:2-aminoadipate transaminase
MPTLAPPAPFEFKESHFSPAAYNLESSILRDILKYSNQPGVISLAGGLPAPELFPVEAIREACDRVLTRHGTQALQYGLSAGYGPLRDWIAERLTKQGGVHLTADNILITAGSQQGLDIVGRAFLCKDDYVMCSRPTYLGALQAFNYYGVKYACIEMDEQGMKVETIDPIVEKYHPKLIYTVPNFQNPTGITMTLERRRMLVEKARKYSVPIVDDNPYGELRYSGAPVPSIKNLGGQAVIQLGTFSKIVSPGLRIAWIAASRQTMGVFTRVKQATDLHTNNFAQYVIHEFVQDGRLERHIEVLKRSYHERRDAILRAMSEFFPDTVKWTKPEGGLFLWIKLPEHVDAAKLLPQAIEEKVVFIPGQSFHADGSGKNTMRLNFSQPPCESLHEGIKRLGRLFSAVL